ncbi:MAG: T9SS type A sorting domain-containing protein, partial [Hymenobacter sp.]
VLPQLARAQGAAAACGNGRYVTDVFSAVTKTTGIVYGQNYALNASTPTTLALDFYEPTNDAATQRPLLIFAFGGSFVSGQRTDLDDLCQAFALKGYATATIDYRLLPPASAYAALTDPTILADEIVKASSDMKAAVRFFRRYATTYRIDPNAIIVAGYSAGAVTALQTAYTDSETEDPTFTSAYQSNGGLEGNTDLPGNPLLPTYNARNLAGVFSLAGGIATLATVSAGNPPFFGAHGDNDMVVPYNYGSVYGTMYSLYGSGAILPQAASVGIANQLLVNVGGDHTSTRSATNRPTINTAAALFFQNIICNAPLPVELISFRGQVNAGTCAATLNWRTASELNSRAFEVQGSANGQEFAPLGTVPSRNSANGAAYAYEVSPAARAAYFRLRLVDVDGSATYSPVVHVAGPCLRGGLQLLPNPAREQVVVSGLPADACRVQLYTATGQLVAWATGSGAVPLNLAALPAGLYLVQASTVEGAPLGQARLVRQ